MLPCEDNALRRLVQDRVPFRVGKFDKLPAEMEYNLVSLLANEIRLFKRLSNLKSDLVYSFDFTTYAAFKSVDRYNEGFINVFSLKTFFRNNGNTPLSDHEAIAIIRRFDIDCDCKIGYPEFTEFINNTLNSYAPGTFKQTAASGGSSPLRNKQKQQNKQQVEDVNERAGRKQEQSPLQANDGKGQKRSQTTDGKNRNKVQFNEIEQVPEVNDSLENEDQLPKVQQQTKYTTPVKHYPNSANKNKQPIVNNSDQKTAAKSDDDGNSNASPGQQANPYVNNPADLNDSDELSAINNSHK